MYNYYNFFFPICLLFLVFLNIILWTSYIMVSWDFDIVTSLLNMHEIAMGKQAFECFFCPFQASRRTICPQKSPARLLSRTCLRWRETTTRLAWRRSTESGHWHNHVCSSVKRLLFRLLIILVVLDHITVPVHSSLVGKAFGNLSSSHIPFFVYFLFWVVYALCFVFID